jgi:hypothetical protein
MKDAKSRLEKLQTDAADCDIIARLATSEAKRDTFRSLADAYRKMAADLAALIASDTFHDERGKSR